MSSKKGTVLRVLERLNKAAEKKGYLFCYGDDGEERYGWEETLDTIEQVEFMWCWWYLGDGKHGALLIHGLAEDETIADCTVDENWENVIDSVSN